MKTIHGGKAKNDRIDLTTMDGGNADIAGAIYLSYKIAKLIRGGNFPVAYVYPKTMRATRDLLRRRTKIVRHGADLKAHIVNTTSQYNLPAYKSNLKDKEACLDSKATFPDISAQRNIDLDMVILECYREQLAKVEWFIEQQARQHNPMHLPILRSINGVGRILSLTIIYEIGNIKRFESVQQFASYSRLVKCRAESAGKSYGTQGNKIGNAHLKWAFSEVAVLYLRGNDKAKNYLLKLQKRMSKAKALSALAHKIGQCIYFMLKNETVFDEERFFKR
jgi:transposase